jgi:hypothetical protein
LLCRLPARCAVLAHLINPLLLLPLLRLKSLQQHFKKKRPQPEPASSSLTAEDEAGDVLHPPQASTDDEEYESRPKRRSVSIDVSGLPPSVSMGDRRPSLEQWHEARRARCAYAAGLSRFSAPSVVTDCMSKLLCKGCPWDRHLVVVVFVNSTYVVWRHKPLMAAVAAQLLKSIVPAVLPCVVQELVGGPRHHHD